jgi:hypothetical protein
MASLLQPFELAVVAGIRLRTLVLVRWIAVAGQLATVGAVVLVLGIEVPLAPVLVAIGASAVLNLALSLWRPVPRLNEGATAVWQGSRGRRFQQWLLSLVLYLQHTNLLLALLYLLVRFFSFNTYNVI